MRITVHGHRPAFLRPQPTPGTARPGDAAPAPASSAAAAAAPAPPGQTVHNVNLGFFKLKIHRQTPMQAALRVALANRQDTGNSASPPSGSQASSASLASQGAQHSNSGDALQQNAALALTLPAAAVPRPMREVSDSASNASVPFSDSPAEEASVRTTSTAASTPLTHAEHLAQWDAWAQAPHAPHENRTQATRRMTDLLNATPSLATLDLRNLGLTSLPAHLPEQLQNLNVTSNQLTRLPERLPEQLRHLYATNNQLSSLPEHLPEQLQTLNVMRNQLTRLPERLPEQLRPCMRRTIN